MKKTVWKKTKEFASLVAEYLKMLFLSPGENQLRISNEKQKRFKSFTQLRHYQKKMRRIATGFILSVIFLFMGIVFGPTIYSQKIQTEVYIPNGKGDILIANVSRNQATAIFRTLDAADENKPLATTATVEYSQDPGFHNNVGVTKPDDYAVTHIIPISGLEENKTYYFRITAKDSSSPANSKTISSWGNENDSIRVFASGDVAPACPTQIVQQTAQTASVQDSHVQIDAPIPPSIAAESSADEVAVINKPETLTISSVQNESHLFAGNKIQAIISWKTNMPASTVLLYREGSDGSEHEDAISSDNQTQHAAILLTLKPGSVYYFKAKSVDAKGNSSISEEYSLRTPAAQKTITQEIVGNFKSLVGQMKFW
ncbi:MAG TPA: fibronectin type III domain-containing protein [Patescibacteria group bacterium]